MRKNTKTSKKKSSYKSNKKFSFKNIIKIFVLLLVILGLGAGVVLSLVNQDTRQQAYDPELRCSTYNNNESGCRGIPGCSWQNTRLSCSGYTGSNCPNGCNKSTTVQEVCTGNWNCPPQPGNCQCERINCQQGTAGCRFVTNTVTTCTGIYNRPNVGTCSGTPTPPSSGGGSGGGGNSGGGNSGGGSGSGGSTPPSGGNNGGGGSGSGSTPAPAIPETLKNGSFDNGTNGWTKSTAMADLWAVPCAQFGPCGHGTHYLRVARSGDGNGYVVSDWVDFKSNLSGKRFEVSFMGKSHDETRIVKVQLQRYPKQTSSGLDWSETLVDTGDVELVTSGWRTTTKTLTFPTPANGNNTTKYRVLLTPIKNQFNNFLSGPNWPVYYDNVSVTPR